MSPGSQVLTCSQSLGAVQEKPGAKARTELTQGQAGLGGAPPGEERDPRWPGCPAEDLTWQICWPGPWGQGGDAQADRPPAE